MIEQTIIDTAKAGNLIDLASNYSELRREASGEYSGPCPKCNDPKNNDRLHVKQDAWFCRQCHPDWGDSIEFVRWLKGVDFQGAVSILTGHIEQSPVARVKPAIKERPAQAPDWSAKVAPMVAAAQARIEEAISQARSEAISYLESRGIDAITALVFGLGYREDAPLPGTWDAQKRRFVIDPQPAVVMPWYRAGRIVAARYRFLQTHNYQDASGKPRTTKQSAIPGSEFSGVLYGGHVLPAFCTLPVPANGRCAEGLRTLVLCEGEMNAMSIWQVAQGWKWDTLSLGSESQKPTAAAISFAERYERVIVWMDKAAIARQLMSMIPRAFAIHSPKVEGKAMDANDLLQSGQLGEFLRPVRMRACRSEEERERVRQYMGVS